MDTEADRPIDAAPGGQPTRGQGRTRADPSPAADARATRETMSAITLRAYGGPEVLRLEHLPVPRPGPGQVLVEVEAASVNAADWHLMRADPFLVRLAFGLFRPKIRVLGADVAGRVVATGEGVQRLRPGQSVFGDLADSGFGAFAEYVCAPESALETMPDDMTFEEAAAVPLAAVAALQGLRDHGALRPGEHVLVHGASGGVGSWAVQIARALGAQVTGVASARKMASVRGWGAHHVVDHAREDVTRGERRFDLVLDAGAFRSPFDFGRVLRDGGRYVMVGGADRRLWQVLAFGWLESRRQGRVFRTMLARPKLEDLRTVKAMLERGEIEPRIDRRYALAETPEAIRYLESGHATGKVVIGLGRDAVTTP